MNYTALPRVQELNTEANDARLYWRKSCRAASLSDRRPRHGSFGCIARNSCHPQSSSNAQNQSENTRPAACVLRRWLLFPRIPQRTSTARRACMRRTDPAQADFLKRSLCLKNIYQNTFSESRNLTAPFSPQC